MGKQAAGRSWHSFEEFAEMAGFHSGFETFRDKGFIKWTNTATQMHTGGVHGLSYKVVKDAGGNPEISLQHWIHWPGGKPPPSVGAVVQENKAPFMVLKTETRQNENGNVEIRPVEAVFNGKSTTDPAEIDHFMHFLQEAAKEMWRNIARNYIPREKLEEEATKHLSKRQTNRRDDIPNLYDIAQLTDFKHTIKLPGKSFNFETNFGSPKPADSSPAYPRDLLYAMLGIEGTILDNNGSDKSFRKSHSIATPGEGGYEGITYEYVPDAKDGFKLACHIWSTNREGIKTSTELYSIGFTPKADNPNILSLDNIAMLPDDRFAPPDMTDHAGVARAIKAMKFVHMAILQGEMPMVSDILDQHHLKPFLRQPKLPEGRTPENPDIQLRVYGANRQAVLTERELGIGSNGADLTFDYRDGGKRVRQRISLDYGVTFGDREKGADTILPNFGRNMRHRNSSLQPDADLILGLETHEHEDHLRGMAKMIRQGFIAPPMVMNQHTYLTLKRMLVDEKAEEYAADALKNCHIVNIQNDIDPQDPLKKRRFEYGHTIIEQYAEEIWSESEQRKKYFPVLDVWTKDHPKAKRHVRIGPAGHSALALMFEVEGVLYTGDYKLDQTLKPHRRTDMDWLAKCKDAAVHIMECTNATKKTPDDVTAALIHQNRKALIRKHSGQRIIADMIGSNALDIENFCETLGEASEVMGEDKIKYVIFAGDAVKNKYSDLIKSDKFKQHLRTKYGIVALHLKTKTAQQLLSGSIKDKYAVIMTGTQDEAFSVSHRVSRKNHASIVPDKDDVFMRLQKPIPSHHKNFQKRVEQNSRLRKNYGATVYDAAEEAVKGNHIYDSSHATPTDARTIHKKTGGEDGKGLLKILHHGGPAQLDGMTKIMNEEGARSMIPDPQCIYRIDRANKTAELAAETFEERLSYIALRSDPDAFFQKALQQVTDIPLKDRWNGKSAEAMYRLERHTQNRLEEKHGHKPTDRGSNLSEEFNDVSGLEDFPPIGIYHPSVKRPYYKHHKNIDLFIGMDSETTGANIAKDLPTSSSFVARDENGKKVAAKTIRHALPPYTVMTPGALLVTKNNKPKDLYREARNDNRFSLREYAFHLFNAYRNWPKELGDDKKARAAFVTYRGTMFDDPISMRVLGMALAGKDMKPMGTHGNMQVDVFNLYSAFLALRPDDVGSKKDAEGNFIRTLETACKTNGVAYENGHDDMYDAEYTLDLFFKLKKIDPDLVEQMVMNSDFSTSRATPMTDHILGQKLHPNGQAPVFGYVDGRDRTCRPRLGALVTLETEISKVSDAIVIDLAVTDPQKLKNLPDHKLLEVMNDPNGPFSVINMKKTPMLFPPQFIYRDGKTRKRAIGRTPKSTILQRANELRKMHKDEQGRTFAKRVQDLYKKSTLNSANSWKTRSKAANDNKSDMPFRLPNERVFALFHVINSINHMKKLYWAEAGKLVRLLQPKEGEFENKEESRGLWTHALKKIREISEEVTAKEGRKDPYIEDIRFLIEWQADNINPAWLPKEDRVRMNALKSAWMHQSIQSFIKELDKIESDPQMFRKLVGGDDKAQERWREAKAVYLAYAESMRRSRRFAMTKEKQDIVNAERRNDPSWNFG